ncbi:MAG: LOG family protein [Candidatus Eremiobacteraeota bacterium]|nr:LOG family protein [Candidatus Eremiobacteraeota bacterium]
MRLKIGVMGSASGKAAENKINLEKCREVGRWIARKGCILVNGACPGLPHEAAYGAREEGGFVLGVSPAFSRHEHVYEYKSPHPHEVYDILLYTGLGFMERDIMNIRSSDGVIFLGGGIGTLNEFTIAFEEGKPIGVLLDSGGISNHLQDIVRWCGREIHENIVFSNNPEELVEKLVYLIHEYPSPIHEDGRVKDVKFGVHRG